VGLPRDELLTRLTAAYAEGYAALTASGHVEK
jgi:hypothetical protein